MKSPRFPTLVRLAALALLGSCGRPPQLPPFFDAGRPDSGVVTPADAGQPMPDGGLAVAEACGLLNQRRCEYLARCGLIADTAQARGDCVRGFEVSWCGPLTWPAYVARGTLKYDPSRAQACADAFAAKACSEFATLPDACTRIVGPRVPLGGDCYDGYEQCTDGVCRGTSCPRTCQPRALLDETCTTSADCRTGLYCKPSSLMPTVGQCAAYGTIGAGCDMATTTLCMEGLVCSNQQCRALPQPGLPCLAGACAESSYCDDSADAGVCAPRKAEGTPCGPGQCQAGLVCDPVRLECVKLHPSAGELCSLAQRCPTGLVCLGATERQTGVCQLPLTEGEACAADRECEPHLACRAGDDGGTVCGPRAPAGAPCAAASTCQAGSTCLQGVCTPLPLPGESCAQTRQCRWGLCRELANSDGGAVCGALLSAGQPCGRNDECASSSCIAGRCVARCAP